MREIRVELRNLCVLQNEDTRILIINDQLYTRIKIVIAGYKRIQDYHLVRIPYSFWIVICAFPRLSVRACVCVCVSHLTEETQRYSS